jgi:hypothetical protein
VPVHREEARLAGAAGASEVKVAVAHAVGVFVRGHRSGAYGDVVAVGVPRPAAEVAEAAGDARSFRQVAGRRRAPGGHVQHEEVAVGARRLQAALALKVEPVDDAGHARALLGKVGAHLVERAVGVGRGAGGVARVAARAFGRPLGRLARGFSQGLFGKPAGEEKLLAAGREGGGCRAVLRVGELIRLAAGRRKDEHLRRAAVIGAHEGERRAAGVPRRAVRAPFAEGELLRLGAPAGVHAPQVRAVRGAAGAVGPLEGALDGVDHTAPAR